MTPEELKAIRHSLGLSAEAFARLIGVKDGRSIRYWESGKDMHGSSVILIEAIRDMPGFRDWLLRQDRLSSGPD